MGLVKLTIWDLRNKVPKIQGPGVGLAISPLLSLFCFFLLVFFFGRALVCIPGAFTNPVGPHSCLFTARAFTHPIWTLSRPMS